MSKNFFISLNKQLFILTNEGEEFACKINTKGIIKSESFLADKELRHLFKTSLTKRAFMFQTFLKIRTIILCTALLSSAAFAQQENPNATPDSADTSKAAILPYPKAMTMPIRTLGIDSVAKGKAKLQLQEIRQNLDQRFLTAPVSLSDYIGQQRPITNNLKRVTGQIMTGTNNFSSTRPLFLEPIWCSFFDQYVFFLQISDTERHTLQSSSHVAIPKKQWEQYVQDKSLATNINPEIEAALTAAISQFQEYKLNDALAVGFNLGKQLGRADETHAQCLNLLLEEKLANKYTIPRTVGGTELGSVRRALKQPALLRRPTRAINSKWMLDTSKTAKRTLPVTITLKATFAETVFGNPFKAKHESIWNYALANEKIEFTIPVGLNEFLENERASLQIADKPVAAKIYRAWVYVDRGRAWGLKMRDRLVADVDGKTIKGHVVRFFGPEEGVTSPRGYPVKEGAIIYIRKGQQDTKIGMTFEPDPRNYPTPWPPKEGM